MPTDARLDHQSVLAIKSLTIDAVQKANSGHPGMPMGMADAAHVLWSRFLRFDPAAPDWPDRDRFILSAGHGCMLHYALLHLYGFDLPIEQLQQFRQLHSHTPGHPERGHTVGIETTTGPLGQGLANGVGMALAEARLRAEFGPELVDHWTWVIAGDGCMMEGVTSEASSLAGHLGLDRLVVLYDSNHITIDGRTEIAFTEDVAARYRAYGWATMKVDGHDLTQVHEALTWARHEGGRPKLIVCETTIGAGSPKLAGSHKVHGAPLGPDEVVATKRNLGLDPEKFFQIPDGVLGYLRAENGDRRGLREAWEARAAAHPQGPTLRARLAPDWSQLDTTVAWPSQAVGVGLSTRKGGEKVLQALAPHVPGLLGGSADLGHSTFTEIIGGGHVQKGDFRGRNVHWGVREHAMGSICNGIAAHGGHVPLNATFLVFHDYMRPPCRLAALMGVQNVFVWTHDSIFVGEDGPTHQPIETLQAIRLIPLMVLIRPADLAETCGAWRVAVERTAGPTALALTRQNLPELQRDESVGNPRDAVARGGYVLREAGHELQVVLVGTGSEVHLCVAARDRLEADGIGVRVVSMPSCELFDRQPVGYRRDVLPPGVPRVSVEAGTTKGWERYVGDRGTSIGIDTFGASAPDKVLAVHFGFTVDNVVAQARRVLAGG
ncbi:MAG: transketolase [Myxococcales bacterium]|nr:transketolase [Myxococcales bacterium]